MPEQTGLILKRTAAAVLAAGCLAILLRAGAGVIPSPAVTVTDDTPVSASLLVENHTCRRGETRSIERRGIEDGYATDNEELARRDRHSGTAGAGVGFRDYDEAGPDMEFVDYFTPPRDTVSGLFVIRLSSAETVYDDNIVIGDQLSNVRGGGENNLFRVFPAAINSLVSTHGWTRQGDIYSVALEDIRLANGETLIDYIQDPDENGVVDVLISNDTAVDFAAIVACSPPDRSNGMTFRIAREARQPDNNADVMLLTCYRGGTEQRDCDPFVGDMACSTPLPLACFRDNNSAVPGALASVGSASLARYWSGGEVRLTDAVAAANFTTIDDADAYCRGAFGDDWRVADFHLGGRGFIFIATGSAEYEGRVWVDIRDQPYGTCWSRE